MIKLRTAKLADYEELVAMYKELLKVVYHGMQPGEDIFIYGAVQNWYQRNSDIVIAYKEEDDTITGFSCSYVEDIGVVQPYYYGDLLYIKPEFRKGKSAYLLYNNVVNYAKKRGLPVIAKAYVGNGNKEKVDKIQERWGKAIFTEYTTGGVNHG